MKAREHSVTLWRILKYAGCIIGGSVAASMLFVAASMTIIGHRDLERLVDVILVWLPFFRILGAVLGGLIAYRSERRRVQKV